MHRTNFRPKQAKAQVTGTVVHEAPDGQMVERPLDRKELEAIKTHLDNMTSFLPMMDDKISRLRPREEVEVPSDIAQSLKLVHERLDRIEKENRINESGHMRQFATFAKGLSMLADQVEKISGGKNNKFSLAQSLERLVSVLENRKYRVIRNNDGDMTALETEDRGFEGENGAKEED